MNDYCKRVNYNCYYQRLLNTLNWASRPNYSKWQCLRIIHSLQIAFTFCSEALVFSNWKYFQFICYFLSDTVWSCISLQCSLALKDSFQLLEFYSNHSSSLPKNDNHIIMPKRLSSYVIINLYRFLFLSQNIYRYTANVLKFTHLLRSSLCSYAKQHSK